MIKMEFYFTLFIGFACVICVSGQTTTKICWDTKWYNDSIQAPNNRSSYEHQSAKVLNSICGNGGPVIAAECKDDKGEPFNVTKNDTANHFFATCNHKTGLICKPYNNSKNATCPDFAIRYGCDCPPPTTNGNVVGSTGSSSGRNSGGTGGSAATPKMGSSNTGTQTTGSGTGTKSHGQQTGQSRNNGNIYGISQYVFLLHLMIVILFC